MKKLLALILAAAMLLSLAACSGGKTANGAKLPKVGNKVEGFVVQEIREFPLVGATVVRFEHEKTGADLVYIANDDTNRVFDLTFLTRAIDNTGLPHVFEHSTLDGSDKYPSKALFFNLSYQTYNTYMNAFTQALMTSYPVASLSEAQLLKYADYYTDSCLHPMIMKDESIFREEAWRYRLPDLDSDLTIEGTVYSEMQGAMSLSSSAYNNFLRAAFPGSTIGNESGGEPEHIPEMTWQSLQDYHNLYYHPSNCVAYLYGQFDDYTAFLKLLNEAFSPYEKREFSFEDPGYQPAQGKVEKDYAYPVEASSTTTDSSDIYYGFLCPGLKQDLQEEMVLNTLTDLLVADASPLMQGLKKTLPTGTFATYIETSGPEDAIVFLASNVDPEDAPVFRDTVDSVLADLAEQGFAQDLVDGIMASLAMSTKLTREGDEVGVDLISSIAFSYSTSGDHFNYLDYVDALDKLDEWNAQGLYKKAISDWLIGCETTVLAITHPEAGLRETLDAAEAERLAGVKASMTQEELQALVDMTNSEDEEDDASAYVAQLQAVTVDSLPEETSSYEVSDKTADDGVRILTAKAGVDGVGQNVLFLNASGLAQEDIHWFALYTAVLGELDTAKHTSEELAVQMTRYLYSGEIRLSLLNEYGSDAFTPYLRAGWISSDEDLEAGYNLMYEILFESDFSDTDTLLGLVQRNKASLKTAITNAPYQAALYHSFSSYSSLYAYYYYYNYLDFYAFLENTELLLEENPDAAVAKLEQIRDYFHNRTGAISLYAGSENGIKTNEPLADAFLQKLDARPIEPAALSFETPAASEALVVDSTVSFNGVVAAFDQLGLEGYSADLDAVSALVTDLYLYPMLRDQYGAYGVFHAASEDVGVYIVSYRDPNVKETFDVYDDLPDYITNLEIDQDTINGYILSSYSYYAMPEGELSGAVNAAISVLTKEPSDLKLQYMRDLKTLTPEKLADYAALYQKLVDNGVRFTAGGASTISQNEELYEIVRNPFGAVDSSQIAFDDLPEDHPHYEAARFMFENLLMLPAEETRFGVDDEATVGDLAATLYALIGGDVSVPDEAVEFLAGYSIVTKKTHADDALTGKKADKILTSFSEAAEVDYTSDENASEDVLTRGELAEILMAYVNAL